MKRTLSIFTLLIFVMVSMNAYGYSAVGNADLKSTAIISSAAITTYLRPCSKALISVSASMFSRNFTLSPTNMKPEIQRNLDKLREKTPLITCCYAAFQSSKTMLLSPIAPLPGDYDPSSRPWFTGAAKNTKSSFVQPIYVDALNGHSILSISKAITSSKTGKLIGVAGVDYDISALLTQLHASKPSNGATIVVFDKNFNIVETSDNSIKAGVPMNTLTETTSLGKYDASFKLNFNHHAYNGYLHREPITGWNVLALLQ